jgi:hypothetical protein
MSGSLSTNQLVGPNASIPLAAGQGVTQPVNPLAMAGQIIGLQNGMNQNMLVQAQQASGRAYQGAIDPQTGAFDANRYRQLLAADPTAAAAAPSGVAQAQSISADQLGQAFRKLDFVNTATSSLLQKGNITPQDVYGVLAQGVGSGIMSKDEAAKQAMSVPQDPAAVNQWVQQHHFQAMDMATRLQETYGTPSAVNNGQSVLSGVTAPARMGGAFIPGTGTPTFPSRAELMGRVPTGVDPNTGAPISGPIANVTPANLAGPAGAQIGNGAFPSALLNKPAGGVTTSAAGAPNLVPGAPAAPGTPTNGNVVTGLGPAATAALGTTGTTSADAFNNISQQGVRAKAQDAVLANMQADTSQFTTGPGQDKIKALQANLQRFAAPIASAFGVKPESIAANESFDKLAAQIADAQGAGSDARLAVTQAANPSSHLTPAGIDMILRQLRGNAGYLQARQQLAAAYPDKSDAQGFEANVASHLDPRAFQYDQLSPTQKATFLSTISDPKANAAFKQSYLWARNNGLLGTPNAGQ